MDKKDYLSDNKKQSALDLKVDSIVTEFMSNPLHTGLSIGVIQNDVIHFYHYGEVKKVLNNYLKMELFMK